MIQLTVPPEPSAMAVIRATIGAVAARASMTLDQIADIRMAVEEAAVLLIAGGQPLLMSASLDEGPTFRVEMSAASSHLIVVEQESLSWMVLEGMSDSVDLLHADDRTTLVMQFARVTVNR